MALSAPWCSKLTTASGALLNRCDVLQGSLGNARASFVYRLSNDVCKNSLSNKYSSLQKGSFFGGSTISDKVVRLGSGSHHRSLAGKAFASQKSAFFPKGKGEIRVRFAPSPTGNLHVGGARTALFNWLYARSLGGKFILRIEDTDLERSTRESEEAVLRDLKWLGLDWDEGPDLGGEFGPYRQSERNQIYKDYADKLVASGTAYPCFCTDEELEAARAEQAAKSLPPVYTGKWSRASKEEVDAELEKGTPHTYRFRVPKDQRITIQDMIRGEVSWSSDSLGDFIILRSNGQPVYNFCVAIDDATMNISHVIRAEEHLPNTLRQVLVYEALGFTRPQFGHVSLILAPDRSKLSKRHGATSVGQFNEMGFLSQAMVNYLAMLGWNDGTEEEIYTPEELVAKFGLDRVTKSAAIFDKTKLEWINGQHLKKLPEEEVARMLGEHWHKEGLVSQPEGPFINEAVELVKASLHIVDSEGLQKLLHYPLRETLTSADAAPVVSDNLEEVAQALLAAHESGALQAAVKGGHDTWSKFAKELGKPMKRKGKRLFMPLRILLTGTMQGPDVGSILGMLQKSEGVVTEQAGLVPLAERLSQLSAVDWAEVTAAGAKAVEEANAKAEAEAQAEPSGVPVGAAA
eukprot:jgi/Mesen1/2142/ME000152S01227